MDELFSFIFAVINSALLVGYYAGFLTLRSARGLARRAVLAGFGAVYFIVQYAVYFSMSLAADGVYDPALATVISFGFLAVHMAALYFLTLAFFKKYAGMNVFLLCSFFCVQEICFRIALGLVNFSFFDGCREAAGVIQVSVYTALCLFFLKRVSKDFTYKTRAFTLTELLYLILPCGFGLAFISLISVMPYGTDGGGSLKLYAGLPFAGLIIPLAGLIFLISLIAVVRLFQKMAELNIEEKEKLVLQRQIKDLNGIYGEIKGMRHDMKNHLYNIRLLAESIPDGGTGGEELEKYMGSFEATLNKFDFTFQTGNPVTDIVLHKRYSEAVNSGINFRADFVYPARLNFDAYDIAVILDNGLENAIEACAGTDEPYVKLMSYIKKEILIIDIENNFTGHIEMSGHNNMPISGKPDKEKHGMGISNIRRCAKKYYGDIAIQISEDKGGGVFRLTVMLQGQE